MTATPGGTSTPGAADPQARAREGVEHLQAAARELIQAARAMLDVAEAMVDDPDAVGQLVGALGVVGDVVRRAGTAGATDAARAAHSGAGAEETDGPDGTAAGRRGPADRPAGAARRRPRAEPERAVQRIAIV